MTRIQLPSGNSKHSLTSTDQKECVSKCAKGRNSSRMITFHPSSSFLTMWSSSVRRWSAVAGAIMRVVSLGCTLRHLRSELFIFCHVIIVAMVAGECGIPILYTASLRNWPTSESSSTPSFVSFQYRKVRNENWHLIIWNMKGVFLVQAENSTTEIA